MQTFNSKTGGWSYNRELVSTLRAIESRNKRPRHMVTIEDAGLVDL